MPKRIKRKRTKGWRTPPNTTLVCRPSKWGNPIHVDPALRQVVHVESGHITGNVHSRRAAVELFRWWLHHTTSGFRFAEKARRELRGQDLCCYCSLDQPCHGDVLLEVANTSDQQWESQTSDVLTA